MLHPCRILVVIAVLEPSLLSSVSAAEPAPAVAERLAQARTELKSDDVVIRKAAISALIHSDLSSLLAAEMQATLNDREGNIRSIAATATENLGAEAVPAVPQLIKQLQSDPVKEARETAARALGRIGKAAPNKKGMIEPLIAATSADKDPVTRVVALGALAMIDVELQDQILGLRKYLHHDEALVRMKAAHALGMIGLPVKAAAPEIVKVLEQETDHHCSGYIARALGNIGDPASLDVLYSTLKKETDAGVQGEIRGATTKLGGKR